MTKPTLQPEGQDQSLVVEGTRVMIEGVLADLKTGECEKQQQALHALNGMARKRAAGQQSQSLAALQEVFRSLGGFDALVRVVNTGSSPLREESVLAANAVDTLVLLTKNNKQNIDAAISAGAVDQLVALVGSGDEAPVSINVLRGMHVLMTGNDRGPVHRAVMEAGGVKALIKLLDTVMLKAEEPDCSTWAREVAALLFELVRNNPCISSFLCNSGVVASTMKILSVCEDPLSLSLGLDILEEIVNSEDRTSIRDAMMAEGAVPALIRMMHVKGIGSKAALALAFMAEDPRHMPVIIAVLEVEDVACICHIAALAADAEDLDAGCCIEFIQALIESGSLHILRCLVMSRCIGVCLSLGALQASLMRQFGEPDTCVEACMLLDSASAYGRLEGALATMELLLAGCQGVRPAPYFPSCCSVMRRNGKVEAIVRVVLDEAVAADAAGEDDATDNEVTALLADLMTYLPRASGDEIAGLAADARAAALNRAKSPATVNPPVEDAAATRGAGFSAVDVNIKRYDSITFIVGGREFYALGWVLEQASARLKRLLAHTDDVKGAVPVPQVDGMPDERMYELFTLAAEFAYTGYAAISPADALELWSVAACLEMDELQVHCENVVNGMLVPTYETLNGALDLACRYRSGNRLRDLCVIYILDHLMDMHESGRLARLLRHSRNKIEEGMIHVLEDRFLIAAKM